MKDTKKPKIRFKEFNDSWEQRKFSELVVTRRGLTYSPNDIRDNGVRVLRSSNIDEDRFSINDDDVFVGATAVNIPTVCNGDILITSANGSSRLVGKHAIIDGIPDNTAVHGGFMLAGSARNPYFANALMSSSWYQKFINFFVAGGNGAIGNLNKNDLDEQLIMVPSEEEEQDTIGYYFRTLDSLITLHQRECEKLLCFKKSMLEKMFPKNGEKYPEIRFSCFTDSWEQRKFSETAQRESAARKSSTDFPSVEYEDVVSEFGILNKDVRLKETQKTGIIFDGSQVLYGKLRPYLHNWLSPDFRGVAVGDWWVLKPVNVDKSFLFRLIQTEKFDDIANQSSGSKMPRADWNLLSNTEFMVPAEIEEERKIGQYFSELDHLITLHQREVDKLAKLKKSMLEKMFV